MSEEFSPGRFRHEIIMAPISTDAINFWIAPRRAVSPNPSIFTLYVVDDNAEFPSRTTPFFCAKHIAESRGHCNGAKVDRREFNEILKLSAEWVASLRQ